MLFCSCNSIYRMRKQGFKVSTCTTYQRLTAPYQKKILSDRNPPHPTVFSCIFKILFWGASREKGDDMQAFGIGHRPSNTFSINDHLLSQLAGLVLWKMCMNILSVSCYLLFPPPSFPASLYLGLSLYLFMSTLPLAITRGLAFNWI